MQERNIRVLPDKAHNRFAIHDAESGELLHVYQCVRDISKVPPDQFAVLEAEAIRDFLVNGRHEDGDEEPGW
jgi:hypothetical protein